MSSTITAMFDTRAEADAAKARLSSAGFDANANIHDKTSTGFSEASYSTHQDRGFWESVKHAFLPEEDRHTYEEGMRRGGSLLTVDVDDDKVDDVVRILEQESSSVDIDDRSRQWKESGWNGAGAGGAAGGAAALFGNRDRADTDMTDRTTVRGDREEVIPVIEEQLTVGKREVNRGGARVRSYVTETPVHEQVRLRDEQINVERRAVDQPLSAADGDAFRERTIDMTATGEEAVVAKNARVVEEVVVSKTASERTENVSDTVRKTEVEVDRDGKMDGETDRSTSFGDSDRRF